MIIFGKSTLKKANFVTAWNIQIRNGFITLGGLFSVFSPFITYFAEKWRKDEGGMWTVGRQHDQMAKLYFEFWAIDRNENLSNIIKICRIWFQNFAQYKINLQRTAKVLPEWRNFVKSGHTDCYTPLLNINMFNLQDWHAILNYLLPIHLGTYRYLPKYV